MLSVALNSHTRLISTFTTDNLILVTRAGAQKWDTRESMKNNSVPGNNLDKFQCNNGQLIASDLLCDGKAECIDKSDETSSECLKSGIICPNFAFRCTYGACVNGNAVCNGVKDCIDNSDEEQSKCSKKCTKDEFQCANGQCIDGSDLCDGIINCTDRSDETYSACESFDCPRLFFRCNYGACINRNLVCNGIKNCEDGSDEDSQKCQTTSISTTTTTTPSSWKPRRSCLVPPQPINGHWKLHRLLCDSGAKDHCDINQGVSLDPGTNLVYSCDSGYKLNDSIDVFCGPAGKWSKSPQCDEIRCESLNSVSLDAQCTYNNRYVSCDSAVLPETRADLDCRTSYHRDKTLLSTQTQVRCNEKGQWEPDPIRCIPGPVILNIHIEGSSIVIKSNDTQRNITKFVEIFNDKIVIYKENLKHGDSDIDIRIDCGKIPTPTTPLIVNGTRPDITEFPWHATLYMADTPDATKKEFICGATIIKDNLLITAAHCVYDETNRKAYEPDKFYIATGNIFQDYDSLLHHPLIVRKAKVKRIYRLCNYKGLTGNYASDIAILEIIEPFVFSPVLIPACLDTTTYSDRYVLETGNYGKVAGFGKTADGTSSGILQSINLPYVPFHECSSSAGLGNDKFITDDKFCAGYKNGSSVCDGDSGGGLVFQTHSLWYLRGIVSVGVGESIDGGTRSCNSYAYSLYTRISKHVEWIQSVILKVETNRPQPTCEN